MSLSDLGVDGPAERLYRRLLANPDHPIGEADGPLVAHLEELGLVRMPASGGPVAVEFGTAVAGLVRRRLNEGLGAPLEPLGPQLLGELVAERPDIERFNTFAEVEARIRKLARDAEVVFTIHNPKRKAPGPARLSGYLAWLAEGRTWRTIVPRLSLSSPGYLDYCLQLHRAGDLHRVADVPVQQMVIIDRTYAFVPTVPDVFGIGALLIREAGAVAALADLFQHAWERATDLELACESDVTDEERQVLHLLATMDKDTVAAREMSVSLRTYHRYVARILTRLGVTNRFQAALQAKERGWI